ncbi:oligosaccharide flippase family protein [uncultured Thiocystis sp.]|jgi:O-antigen/teichoic acid export membrane protein|uniref:lipopolysaccharide biosynthesis protein n=1 Tax=uncultured Thiocystis sp. TaxID=1202134 RepID=UPI0025D03630|nr:oligosaccharide flippase family protein [uncultured Thiocystis sp.]
MKKLTNFKKMIKSKLLRQILTLFSGKAAAQIVLLGSAPIITRLFEPSDYGAAALLIAIAQIATPVATLSYSTAVQLTNRDIDARKLVALVLMTACLFVSIMTLLMLLLNNLIHSEFMRQFGGWEWFIPLMLLLYSIETVISSWNTRMKQFKIQATTYVTGNVVGAGSRILLGWAGGSSVGALMVGYLLGTVTRVTYLIRRSSIFSPSSPQERVNQSTFKQLAVQYRDFPQYAMPTAILQMASKKLPLFFFGSLFSPAAAGFYAMSERLFLGPLNLLQTSIRAVYTQHTADAVKKGRKVTPILAKATFFTAGVTLVPALLLHSYGEPGLTWLLTEKWSTAGTFLEIMSPMFFFSSLAIPANAVMVVCRRQSQILTIQIGTSVALVAGVLIAYSFWGTAEAALHSMVIVYAIRHLHVIILAFSICDQCRRMDTGMESV